ncbi:hypothetical protein DFH07DRAFT_774950 [Mycena maculata]|uniref:Uncharacterized protein n=1 Tax=Mycena maculata TaxID=230809 RepID=A0AAD7IUV4_9AGAR|nr:hypothetical protein DFH07DRAFT_774950 [Mycena maculata]
MAGMVRPRPDPPMEATVQPIHIWHPSNKLIVTLWACRIDPTDKTSPYGLPQTLVLEACKIMANNLKGTFRNRDQPDETVSDKDILPRQLQFSRPRMEYSAYPLGNPTTALLCDLRTPPVSSPGKRPGSKWPTLFPPPSAPGAVDYSNPTVQSPNNQFGLRSDLNGPGYDKAHFCFYPFQKQWVMFSLTKDSLQLAHKFNFTRVPLPQRLRAVYLYARFAWRIFLLAEVHFASSTLLFVTPPPSQDSADQSDGGDDSNDGDVDNSAAQAGPTLRSHSRRPDGYYLTNLSLIYRQSHPAATDPGNARIAHVSERDE